MRPSPAPTLRAAILCGALLVACGGSEAPETTTESRGAATTTAPEDEVPAVDPDHPERAFTERPPARAAGLAAFFEEADAMAHDWPSEAYQEAARSVLASFVETAHAGGDVAPFLADGFAAAPLRPEALDDVRARGPLTVRRADAPSSDAVEAPLDGLRTRLAFASEVRCEVEFIHAQLDDDGALESEALVTVLAVSDQRRLQINALWRLAWSVDGATPRLRTLVPLRHEEVELPAPLFGDLTEHAFGQHGFFRTELMLGVDDYQFRQDVLGGSPFIGSQGFAIGDANGDGRDDLFVAMPAGLPNRLFLAQADGTAVDVAPQANLAFFETVRGALFVDLDGDGDQDLAMSLGPNIAVVKNDGKGMYRDLKLLPSEGPDNVFSISAADADGDGDLDLYATRYVQNGARGNTVPTPYHDAENGATNSFWRNDGTGEFTDATEESGLGANNTRFSLASIWEDFDLDGDLDLYVSNDFGQNNHYVNDGEGHFIDAAAETGGTDMAAGMGTSVADYDHDGDMDLYVSNMFTGAGMRVVGNGERFMPDASMETRERYRRHAMGNTLLRNRGDGTFEDVSWDTGAAIAGWSWGGLFADFDGDGWEDLYVPNGFITGWQPGETNSFYWRSVTERSPLQVPPTQEYIDAWTAIEHLVMREGQSWSGYERNKAFLNTRDGRFADAGAALGVDFLEDARAVGRVDWDDDGRVDLVVKSRTAPRLRLLRNQSETDAHFIAFDLVGTTCNRDAIGARVAVELEDRTLRRTLHAGSGFLAQSSKRLLFGIGDAERVRAVEVVWPDGKRARHEDLAIDARYRLVQGSQPERVELSPVAGLDKRTTAPLTKADDAKLGRVVLTERLPIPELPLPGFASPLRRGAELAGAPTLVTVFSATSPESRLVLERLERAKQSFDQAGLRLVPLTIDPPDERAGARALLEEHGLGEHAGYVDERSRLSIEVLLSGLFGATRSTPLPTSFLLDRKGRIAVVYLGRVRPAWLRADATILLTEAEDVTHGGALGGGYWLFPLKRSYGKMLRAFEMLGERDQADVYRELRRDG